MAEKKKHWIPDDLYNRLKAWERDYNRIEQARKENPEKLQAQGQAWKQQAQTEQAGSSQRGPAGLSLPTLQTAGAIGAARENTIKSAIQARAQERAAREARQAAQRLETGQRMNILNNALGISDTLAQGRRWAERARTQTSAVPNQEQRQRTAALNDQIGMTSLLERGRKWAQDPEIRYSMKQKEYDQVSREMEATGLDKELDRLQTELHNWDVSPYTEAQRQEMERRASELARQVEDQKERQAKLANQLYELRNQRDAARLRSTKSGTLREQYNALRAADQELDRLQTELHNTDYSAFTEDQRLAMERRATELDRQVKEQKKLFDDAAKAAGYETTYDGLKEYEARQRRAQSVAQIRQSTRESAGTPGGALALSALTVPGNVAQGVEYLGQLLGNIGRNDPGNLSAYRPLDPNAMPMTNFGQDVQGTVAQNIRGENPTMLSNAAAFLYETGMSITNSAAQVATLGPVLSLASMGGSAAAQRTREVLENGGSNRQALVAGAASGVFEALFEKFSVDNLVKTKSVTGWKSWVKETAKQAGIEASEEMFTEIANICADAAIMGDSSDFARNVEQYRFQGLSEEEAKQQAFLDAVGQVAMAGLGGAISGGVMGGVTNAWQGSQNNSMIQNAGRGVLPDAETVSRLADSEAGQEVLEQMDRQYEMYQRRQAASDQLRATEPTDTASTPPSPAAGQNETAPEGGAATKDRTAELLTAADRGEMPDTDTLLELAATDEGVQVLQQVMERVNRYEERTKAAQNEPATQEPTAQPVAQGPEVQAAPAAQEPTVQERRTVRTEGRETAAPGVRDLRGQSGGQRLASLYGDEDVDFLDRLGKAAGVTINIVGANERVNGWYQDGQVYIAENNEDPVRQVAKHEITHYLRDMATEDYSRYEALVRETLQAEGSLDSQMETYRRRYQEATGRQYTDAEVMEELAADFTERLLIDENAINRLASQDQSLGRRILAAIRRFLSRVRNALTGRQTTQLEQAARMWENALGQAGTNARAGAQTAQGNEARYSLREFEDGRRYVDVESNQARFDGLSEREMSREARAVIQEKYKGKVIGLENRAYVNGRTAAEYSYPARKLTGQAHEAKMRASTELDNLLDAGTNFRTEPDGRDGHIHPEAVGDFRYFDTVFKVGNEYYSGVINIEPVAKGLLLKDVTQIRNITQDIRSSYGDEPQTTFLRDASMDSVAQPGEDVNTDELRGLELPRLEDADQTTQTENPDVRHSLRGVKSEAEQIEELRKQNQRLEDAQAGTANVPDMTDQEAKTEARRLLMEYGSMADSEETAGLLQGLYNYMREAGAKPNDSTVREVAKTIAQNILDSASETDDAMWRDYEGLRKFLKDTKIKVPRDTWGGLDAVGGYNEFRKQYFGRLNLSSTEGRGIDDVYQELSFDYPGLFDQDAHPNPDDQILQIAETLDAIRPESFNPYAGDRAGAADYLAGEILERYYDRRTDRQVSEAVKKERQRGMDRQKKRLKQVRDQRDEKIKAIKEKNRQAARKAREKQTTAQVRDRVCRHAKGLSRRLLNPRDDFRIPEKLRGYTLALLDDLDLGSGFGYEFTTEGKFKRAALVDENGKPVGANVERTGRTEAALQLKKALEELGKDESLDVSVDPDLADKLNEIAEMKGIPVGGMTRAQAETTWEVIRALESVISNADKTLGQSKYKKLSDMANAMWDAVGDRKDRRNFAVRPLAAADKLVNLDMMTPETFLHRLGKPGDEIHRQMRAAQDKQITITNEGVEQFQAALKESGLTARDLQRAERENHTFTTADGQDITLTTAQLMDLYALSHRKQAMDHIYTGGLRTQGGRKGAFAAGQAAPVHVTLMDVANMLHELTPAQKGFVDRLQAYMSTTLAAHGNEATMEVYGYEKFKEQNYWPIKVNRNETKTDPAQEARSKTIPGYGMTKALTPNANNSVMLRSAVDTYAEHLNQMSTYAGWLAASENITKLHNFTFFEDGQRTGTIKELFDRVYGTKGNAYLDDLLSDVAQGTKTGAESTFSDSLLNKFKAAKVGANLRVIFQQPTAILRAAEVIDPKYMATVKNPLKGFERAKKWSPIALWKDWGYFEMDTGRSLRELMVGTEGALDKLKNVAMGGAGLADNVAWGHLWNAVEAETRAEHKELRAGSDAFYQQCARRFGEIIDRTQVVDSVLHRTQIMRSSNFANRLATSFMSEPSKIYNMAARDFYDIIHAEKGSQEQKRAVKHVVRTGAALIASFAVNAIAQSAPDWWRDDDRDKEFVRTFQDKWVKNFTENFDPVGYIPYLKDIESIIQGYDVERSDMEGIADLWSAAETMMKAASGTGKKSVINAGLELAMKGLDLMGLPAGNIKRDVVGILNTVLWGTGEWETVYEMDKLMLDVGNANNANVFYDTLYRAMDGDWMEYQRIYGDMLESGFDPDKINTAMNKRMAQDAGLTKAKHLPMEWAPPGEDPEFDAMVQVEGSWLDQTDEEALELARTLDSAELEGETDSEKNRSAMRMIADQPFGEDVKEMSMEGVMSESAYAKYMAARAAGVSTYDYVDFLEAAREANLARGKSGSSFSQDDVTKALEGSGLTSAQKRAIWDTYGWKTRSPWG